MKRVLVYGGVAVAAWGGSAACEFWAIAPEYAFAVGAVVGCFAMAVAMAVFWEDFA